jgi:hypothetical protein
VSAATFMRAFGLIVPSSGQFCWEPVDIEAMG